MRSIIISSGNFNIENLNKIKKEEDTIICADGGARHLYKTDIVPDMIVGDLDSLGERQIDYYKRLDVEFHKFPSEKDYTDTELAIEYSINSGAKEIIFLGATGTRLDHTLANIMLLYKLLKKKIKAKIIDDNNEIYMVDKTIEVEKEEGTYVSLLPIFGDCKGVSISGFKYLTDNLDFELGSTMGISNEVKSNLGVIEIRQGLSLVIKSRD